MKKFLLVLFMLFISRNCLAYTLEEAYDIYTDSSRGKKDIILYTNGFIKGFAKGYISHMIKSGQTNDETVDHYDLCLRRASSRELLKQVFAMKVKKEIDKEAPFDLVLMSYMVAYDIDCILQRTQTIIEEGKAKHAE